MSELKSIDKLVGQMCHIVSDGTNAGTLLTLPNGTRIPFVQRLEIVFDANGSSFASVKLEILASVDANLVFSEAKLVDPVPGNNHVLGSNDPAIVVDQESKYEPDGL
jgi:hypothetical protein